MDLGEVLEVGEERWLVHYLAWIATLRVSIAWIATVRVSTTF